jgi:hypothetical protein
MTSGIALSMWGKCHICGRDAVVGVSLNYCRFEPNGRIYEPSYRTMVHPDHPFLCGDDRHVPSIFGEQLVVPSEPDADGNVRIRYPFPYEGWYVTITDYPASHADQPDLGNAVTRPASSNTRSSWPAAAEGSPPAVG